MKIDRLMGIVVYLLNNGRTSARKLAGEFEVSARTIMRDLESLDRAGIPIQSFYGPEGGYQIMASHVLRKQAVSNREYDWIAAALKGAASAYPNKDLLRILAKVTAVNQGGNPAVSMDLGAAAEDEKIGRQLALLENAIQKKHLVRFSYTNRLGEVKNVQVDPALLQYKWYNWYLIGYYEERQDYCMFKLVRMDCLEETELKSSKAHRPSEVKIREQKEELLHIKLYGKASAKARCREYLHGKITREFENGDFEFCFSAPEQEAFWYGALLSFGNQVRILEPQTLRERIVKTCKEIQAEYEKEEEQEK